MAKTCNRCGKVLVDKEVYYCEPCRQIVRQEFIAKENDEKNTNTEINGTEAINVNGNAPNYAEQSNTIGRLVKTLGFVFIIISILGGLIIGSMTGTYDDFYERTRFNWGVALSIMLGGSFYGLMIIAVGEIILLLQGSNNKLSALLKLIENQKNDNVK